MSDLKDLYQEVILDHNRRPRNFHAIAEADCEAAGHNPLCGDNVTVYLRLEGERVVEAAFVGSGCAISKASASLMTETITGKSLDEIEALATAFRGLVTGQPSEEGVRLGKLAALGGVAEFPVRVKCATLAWHTLQAALDGGRDSVTTE